MNFDSGTAYAESDADDEYERSLHSPVLATDSEISPTDSEGRSSTEHTPTTYGHRSSADRLPETIITEWTAEECADFVATIGLEQYSDRFLENEIVGEALVALLHDDLKSMGVASVGHRLTILKSVYDVKKAQDIPIESDHYVPQSAEAEAQYATATLKDIKHLVEQLRLRDERMSLVEQDLRRLTDDYRRLREDMLPALRLAKNAQQPLPNVSARENQGYSYESSTISPPAPTPSSIQSSGGGLKRQYSTKKIVLGTTPKNASPSYLQTTHERPLVEQTLDPASAAERAVLSSSHLAAMNGSGQATSPGYSPNIPSPTSPPTMGSATLGSRSYRSDQPTPSSRSTFAENDHIYNPGSASSKQPVAPRRMQTPAPDTPGSGSSSVEIFKSFRVSMDDPCYKVLPAALRKYQINAPWDQYALYIVYGDQERCLGLDEKPLILFKQLDKEGKKPMFMLRKTNTATADTDAPGSAGLSSTNARGVAYDPPGGII
ncbi:protein kinase regulator Ste50 [Apiospora kogelbergensis]|uniref:Protein kinase regulator Ste50 n=1 Tax=Apiospora kogelbergensis TaxID=1337665 RepID=A0AAW0QEJ2_9PEZI